MVTVLISLFPPDVEQVYSPDQRPPGSPTLQALFVYPLGLAEAGAACSNQCTIQVCVRWIPGPSAECPRPGPGGGCCTDYEDQCDPDCSDPDPVQPPAISGSQSCSQNGSNGWCTGTLSLNLSASDPQGQTVLISGDVSGTAFACANGATSCSVPLPEGYGAVNYTVTSATGLTASGSQSYQRDGTAPQINGSLSGTSGENGWYVSEVDASATASDSVSGVTSFVYTLDGGTWTAYSVPLSLSDGEYTLMLQAANVAGLQSQTTQTIKVDTITPDLDLSLTGTPGSNGWYKSNVEIIVTADDTGSGLEDLEYELDGGGRNNYTGAFTLTDGEHTLDVIATDEAGNQTPFSQVVKVDTITPLINVSNTGTSGTSGWYVSNIQVSASGSDAGSGLASFEYSLDDGGWTAYASALSYSDGQHSLEFRAIDQAGNITTTPAQTYRVDTTPPVIDLPDAWNLGTTTEYEVTDVESGVASVRIVIEDDLERWPKLSWYDAVVSDIAWDGRFADETRAPDGEYYATLTARDQAGNESKQTGIITVENNLFTLFLPPFNPPTDTPLPAGEGEMPLTSFGGENNNNASIPVTGLFSAGGVTTVSGTSGTADFASQNSPDSPATNIPNSDILWSGAAAAAIGAFTAEILRKKQEEEWATEQEVRTATRHMTVESLPLGNQTSSAVGKVLAAPNGKGLAVPVPKALADNPPWEEWLENLKKGWTDIWKGVGTKIDETKDKFRDTLVGQLIPELTWTELDPTQRATALQSVSGFGSYGAAAATYLQQNNVKIGYFPQQTGAGWTLLGHVILRPGINLNSDFNNSLIVHETLHLQQGHLTRLSVYGELLAWQLQYDAYYDVSGKYLGQPGTEFYDASAPDKYFNLWRELSQLNPDSLQDLERARQLMIAVDPNYRANSIPLEPITKTISNEIVKSGENVANSIITGGQNTAAKISQAGQQAANKITSLGTSVADKITQASTTTANSISQSGQNAAKVVTQTSQNLAKGITAGGQTVANLVANVSPGAANAVVKVSQSLSTATTKAGQAIANGINSASQTISNGVQQGGQSLAKAVTSGSQSVSNTVSTTTKAVANTVTKVTQSAANTVKSLTASIGNLFWNP